MLRPSNPPWIDHSNYTWPIFLSLGPLFKESVQVRGTTWHFVTHLFYGEELLAPCPTPKLEDIITHTKIDGFICSSRINDWEIFVLL
jgi:hypothetical protein